MISIHAPRMGSDVPAVPFPCIQGHFNPRSPHGERRDCAPLTDEEAEFQSTLPAWGATTVFIPLAMLLLFQSTLPAWGATMPQLIIMVVLLFQSTLPAWGATRCKMRPSRLRLFQSTLPAWGATTLLTTIALFVYFNPRSPHGERRAPWRAGDS